MLIFKHMHLSTQKYQRMTGRWHNHMFSLFLQLILVSTWPGYDFTSEPMYYYDGEGVNSFWGAP